MLESLKSRGGKRWPRGQKFTLSSTGAAAEATYREAVAAARAQGRGALENAERAWAEPLRIQGGDGVVLGELRSGKKSISELALGLQDCGVTQAEVKAAIDRLTDAALVEPASVPTEVAA
jgi:hypothetical protein